MKSYKTKMSKNISPVPINKSSSNLTQIVSWLNIICSRRYSIFSNKHKHIRFWIISGTLLNAWQIVRARTYYNIQYTYDQDPPKKKDRPGSNLKALT